MNNLPLVSVIIPNYNHGAWVAQRIDTVLGQAYQQLELIILDDASTDESRSILEKYQDHPKVSRLVFSDQNSGSPFIQWKKGLALATGELVWIAESDDFSHPGLLQQLIPAFEDRECVLAFCEVVFVDKNGETIIEPVNKPPKWYNGREYIREHMTLYDSLVNAGMVVFRRSALQQVSDAFLGYQLSGDYRLFCEIILQGKIYGSGQPHAFFRKHGAEVTSRFLGTMTYHSEHLEIVEWLIKLGIATPAQVRDIAKRELTALLCIGKGMPKAEFTGLMQFFKKACMTHNVSFPYMSASYHSYKQKWQHWWLRKVKPVFQAGLLS